MGKTKSMWKNTSQDGSKLMKIVEMGKKKRKGV